MNEEKIPKLGKVFFVNIFIQEKSTNGSASPRSLSWVSISNSRKARIIMNVDFIQESLMYVMLSHRSTGREGSGLWSV